MKNLAYFVLRDTVTRKETAFLDDFDTYKRETFSPCIETVCFFFLEIEGKNYAERKENASNKAWAYSTYQAGGLYWSDLAIIGDFFERVGKRYGLLTDFRENAII